MKAEAPESMVQGLAHLLRDHGDGVLDGSHVLTLLTPNLQVVTRLFEQLFPRGPGSGFQALPAHPADSYAILRTQFLLDVLQKTPELKLIHPPECARQFDVNIFPFKCLKNLELRCLPPHCLRGLRGVYSQLEVLTCSQCVSSLEEVISLCGGDLSSALPWLELHTLNFSYNTIHSLDQSLELLNSLRIMDLSHNCIKDCGPHLKVLSELRYLNLGYNCLESIPELSLQSSAQLHTLILSYNQISSTSGLEHLSNLQHLDLSYNQLLDHTQLKGLARLHNLKQLFLEGNPLYYHAEHRALTGQNLSRKASDKVLLDGQQMTALETAVRLHVYKNTQVFRERLVLPQPCNSATESSCTGELSDSCSATEKVATRLPRKKSKVKVRRASISERSDSECEQRSQTPVLQHQKDIERTDSFRDQFGIDWLQYRPHLEDELSQGQNPTEAPRRVVHPQPFTKSKSSPTILQAAGRADSQSPVPARPPTPEVTAVTAAADLLIEKIEDVLEDGLWKPQIIDRKEEEAEEEVIEGTLCSPVTVCPILDGQPRNPDWPWVFLRVTRQNLLEIDLERGRVLIRRELQSLRDIQTSITQWDWNGEQQELPVLTLYFYSVCEDKQCARYVVLDNTQEISIKTLLDVLNPILEDNLRLTAESEEGPPKLQCLKCKTEFVHQEDSGVVFSPEGVGQTQDKTSHGIHTNHSDHAACPSCGSSHVILAPSQQNGYSSTPTPSGDQPAGGAEGQKSFYLGDEKDGSEASGSCPDSSDSALNGSAGPDPNVSGLTGSYKYRTDTPPAGQNSMVLQDNWQVSPTSLSPNQTLDFRLVDHRLKLYLDMEVLGGEMEEFQCYMKVPLVRFGKEGEFWALVVVSNQKFYFLEITGDTSGAPCDWLRPGEEQSLASLTHLHIGLQKQTLHLGFNTPEAAYTLLTRNANFSTAFAQHVLDTLSELPPRYRSSLDYRVDEEVVQGHRLWNLLHDNLGSDSCGRPEYRYVLAHFLREDVSPDSLGDSCVNGSALHHNTASPAARAQGAAAAQGVSLLLTSTHMYILEETHQWLHTPPPAAEDADREGADGVQVAEKQPISSISSVHLYSSASLHLRIHLYNETQQKESAWLLWTEDPDLPKEISDWLRVPWEAEYHIRFNQVTHETLD